jgi:hypothetical protein
MMKSMLAPSQYGKAKPTQTPVMYRYNINILQNNIASKLVNISIITIKIVAEQE